MQILKDPGSRQHLGAWWTNQYGLGPDENQNGAKCFRDENGTLISPVAPLLAAHTIS